MATSSDGRTRPTAGWSSSHLTGQGRARVLADRKLRDEWLARQLRERTAEERTSSARRRPSCTSC